MTLAGFDAVAKTSLLTTALRARESERPDRLYDDPFAQALVGETGMALFDAVAKMTAAHRETVAADGHKLPDTMDYNAIRTRFIDDWLAAALREGTCDQVVIAAAGMDTRTHRLAWPSGVDVYELDRPAVLDHKQAVLAAHAPAGGVRRRLVRADLVTDDWRRELTAAGFDPARPAIWVLEGLFYYLSEAEAHGLLAELADFCVPGSPLICDLINAVALTSPSTRNLLKVFADWGSPWRFGTDEPEKLLANHGFETTAVQPGEPGADYGRWHDPVVPRDLPDVPRVFYVHGKRA